MTSAHDDSTFWTQFFIRQTEDGISWYIAHDVDASIALAELVALLWQQEANEDD